MTERVVTIPGTPSALLSLNARCHWRVKAKAVKEARHLARMAALEQHGGKKRLSAPVTLSIVIGWEPRRQKLDWDNAIASCKAFCDGIVDAGCVMADDRHVTSWTLDQVRDGDKRGFTQVTVREMEERS